MIEIEKSSKGDTFTIAQTKRIVGIDFHKQMSLTPGEMSRLCEWFDYHFMRTPPCTSLDEVKDRLALIHSVSPEKITYTEFNGKLLSSDMTSTEITEKVFGKLEDKD